MPRELNSAIANSLESASNSSSNSSIYELETTAVAAIEVNQNSFSEDLRNMANSRVTQLVAELETIIFQLKEHADTVRDDLATMQLKDCNELYDEVKELRITMIKYNRELTLLNTGNDANLNFTEQVNKLCQSSKG